MKLRELRFLADENVSPQHALVVLGATKLRIRRPLRTP